MSKPQRAALRDFPGAEEENISFMHYDLGYCDHETCRLESVENPFRAKVLPMSPV